MQDLGFLNSEVRIDVNKKKPIRYYQYVEFEIKEIPKWKDIGTIFLPTQSCRKKGIKVSGGKEGKKGKEGKGTDLEIIPTNSPNSLNSPLISGLVNQHISAENEEVPVEDVVDSDKLVHLKCSVCGETPCSAFSRTGQPLCKSCQENPNVQGVVVQND